MANRVIIITGAAGGIGGSLVREFSDSGYQVIATDMLPLPDNFPSAHYIQVDFLEALNNDSIMKKTFSEIRSIINGSELKGLINNAAVQKIAGSESLTLDDWRKSLDVNVISPFMWSREFLSELELAKGCVLNIGSIHARLTKPDFVAYSTSKAALNGLTRAMAVELGHRVRFNAIEPAAVMTDMLKCGFKDDKDALSSLARYHPSRSIGMPDDLAYLARLIIEAKGGFLNGSVINFDGGLSSTLCDPAWITRS